MAPGIPDLVHLMHAQNSKPATAAGLTAQPALSEIEATDVQGTPVQRQHIYHHLSGFQTSVDGIEKKIYEEKSAVLITRDGQSWTVDECLDGSLEELTTADVLIWQERCVRFSIMCKNLHWKTLPEKGTIGPLHRGRS